MADANTTAPRSLPQFIGNYQTDEGCHISIERGSAADYASMRAGQLHGLLTLLYGAGGDSFREYSDTVQENVLWLAANLAGELEHLIPIIDADDSPRRRNAAR